MILRIARKIQLRKLYRLLTRHTSACDFATDHLRSRMREVPTWELVTGVHFFPAAAANQRTGHRSKTAVLSTWECFWVTRSKLPFLLDRHIAPCIRAANERHLAVQANRETWRTYPWNLNKSLQQPAHFNKHASIILSCCCREVLRANILSQPDSFQRVKI